MAGMTIPAGDGQAFCFLFVYSPVAGHALTVVGGLKFKGSLLGMTGGTSGSSIFLQLIFIQDVFPILVIVMTVKAFVSLHVVFVGKMDCRPGFTAVDGSILNIDFSLLGICIQRGPGGWIRIQPEAKDCHGQDCKSDYPAWASHHKSYTPPVSGRLNAPEKSFQES